MTYQSEHIDNGLRPIILPSPSRTKRLTFISRAKSGFDPWRRIHLLNPYIILELSAQFPTGATTISHSFSDTPIFKFVHVATFHHTPQSIGARNG